MQVSEVPSNAPQQPLNDYDIPYVAGYDIPYVAEYVAPYVTEYGTSYIGPFNYVDQITGQEPIFAPNSYMSSYESYFSF